MEISNDNNNSNNDNMRLFVKVLKLFSNKIPFHYIPIDIICDEICELGLLNKNQILEYLYHTSDIKRRKLLNLLIPENQRLFKTNKTVIHNKMRDCIRKITDIKNHENYVCELLDNNNKVKLTAIGVNHTVTMPFKLNKYNSAKWEIYVNKYGSSVTSGVGIASINHKIDTLPGDDRNVPFWGKRLGSSDIKEGDTLICELNKVAKMFKIYKNDANTILYSDYNVQFGDQILYPICSTGTSRAIFTFQRFEAA